MKEAIRENFQTEYGQEAVPASASMLEVSN